MGVLTLISLDDRRSFTGADLLFGADLASRVATAVDNARLYREAKEAVRGREDVLSFVAHDLRGFLFGTRVGIDILLRSIPKTERRQGWKELGRVQRLNAQMARMIEDLLDVSSLDSGRLSLNLAKWGASDLVSQAVEAFAATAADGDIGYTADAPDRTATVYCDAGRVMQIFGNIVGNAVKFTPKGGSITISVSPAGEQVQFAVRDTGPGMVPEHQGAPLRAVLAGGEQRSKGERPRPLYREAARRGTGGPDLGREPAGHGHHLLFYASEGESCPDDHRVSPSLNRSARVGVSGRICRARGRRTRGRTSPGRSGWRDRASSSPWIDRSRPI